MKLFNKIIEVLGRIISNKKVVDSGMRTDSNGNIYVDKEVFFNRPEVKRNIDNIIKSTAIVKSDAL